MEFVALVDEPHEGAARTARRDLDALQCHIQDLINCITWSGPPPTPQSRPPDPDPSAQREVAGRREFAE